LEQKNNPAENKKKSLSWFKRWSLYLFV